MNCIDFLFSIDANTSLHKTLRIKRNARVGMEDMQMNREETISEQLITYKNVEVGREKYGWFSLVHGKERSWRVRT